MTNNLKYKLQKSALFFRNLIHINFEKLDFCVRDWNSIRFLTP